MIAKIISQERACLYFDVVSGVASDIQHVLKQHGPSQACYREIHDENMDVIQNHL